MRKVTLLFYALCLQLLALAQNPCSYNSDLFPFPEIEEDDSKFVWSSGIYGGDIFNNAPEINHLFFHFRNDNTIPGVKIYIRNTNKHEYDGIAYPGLDGFLEVFSGQIPASSNMRQVTIPFANTFYYTGNNIEILFEATLPQNYDNWGLFQARVNEAGANNKGLTGAGPTRAAATSNNYWMTAQKYATAINATCLTVLPVTLTSFDVVCRSSDNISFNWEVAMEDNNQFFTVEYAADGRNWNKLTDIESKGNTTVLRQYRWEGKTPVSDGYYRLRQTDLDGQTTIASSVIRANCAINQTAPVVFPNPFNEELSVKLQDVNAKYRIELYTAAGQQVQTKEVANTAIATINTKALISGLYIVRIVNVKTLQQYQYKVVK